MTLFKCIQCDTCWHYFQTSENSYILFSVQYHVGRKLGLAINEHDFSLQWRHNEHDGVSNHQPYYCLLNFIQTQIKENTKGPRHWPLWGEFTGDQWIPRTNGQLRGICFHLMTSSCGLGPWWVSDRANLYYEAAWYCHKTGSPWERNFSLKTAQPLATTNR